GIKFILLSTPGYMFILGGVERIIVFPIQIALSLIVLYGVRNRKYIFLLYAIVFHAVVDFLPALSHNLNINIFWVEGYLLVMAIISVIFIFKSKTMFTRSSGESLEHTKLKMMLFFCNKQHHFLCSLSDYIQLIFH